MTAARMDYLIIAAAGIVAANVLVNMPAARKKQITPM